MDKSLEYARSLIGYISIHNDTPRALILFNHLAQLACLAGIEVTFVPAGYPWDDLVSLHEYHTGDMMKKARERIDHGLIPEDWDEVLERVFQEKGVTLQRLSL